MSIATEPQSKRPKFTPEQAREAALKSHEAQRMRKLALTLAQPADPAHDLAPKAKPDDYMLRRLTRVRGQLDRLDEMMRTEMDPQKLDRIASAQAKLAEQERQLAGRPLPGSLRPTGKQSAASMIEVPTVPAHSQAPAVKTEEQE